ncbi:MAG: hypothetical protein AABX65_03050, partial [Nanoarchaeota archaeon]
IFLSSTTSIFSLSKFAASCEVLNPNFEIIAIFFSSFPQLKNPISGAIVKENFNFEFENADRVLIADNAEFKDAIVLNETSKVFLKTGEYYWKTLRGDRESSVERFYVEGKNVSLGEFIAGEIRRGGDEK